MNYLDNSAEELQEEFEDNLDHVRLIRKNGTTVSIRQLIDREINKVRLEGFTTDPEGISLHKESYLRGELNMIKNWVYIFDTKYDGVPFIEEFRSKWKDDNSLIKGTLATELKEEQV